VRRFRAVDSTLPATTVCKLRNAERKLPNNVPFRYSALRELGTYLRFSSLKSATNPISLSHPRSLEEIESLPLYKYLLLNLDQRLKMNSSHRNSKQLSKNLKQTNLRSFGYGSVAKPPVSFSQNRPSAPTSGAAWRTSVEGAWRCLQLGCVEFAPFPFQTSQERKL